MDYSKPPRKKGATSQNATSDNQKTNQKRTSAQATTPEQRRRQRQQIQNARAAAQRRSAAAPARDNTTETQRIDETRPIRTETKKKTRPAAGNYNRTGGSKTTDKTVRPNAGNYNRQTISDSNHVTRPRKNQMPQNMQHPKHRQRQVPEPVFREEDILIRHRGPDMVPPPKRHRPMSGAKKRFFLYGAIILALLVVYCGYQIGGNLNRDLSSSRSRRIYAISDEAAQVAKAHRIVNVAVFGIDGREDVDGDRSDTIMIATADFEHSTVKITSIMRDTLVYIEDENDFDKINAAYSLGGAEGALAAINRNFDTAITDYVTVDFNCMATMVNAVGGVDITIDDEEVLEQVNLYLVDVNDKLGTVSPAVEGTGTVSVDGSQALAYCRVRFVGNGDFDRTARQREVFEQVVNKALALNPFEQYNLLVNMMPYIDTSLSFNEILKYAANVMIMRGKGMDQMRIPVDDYCDTGFYGEVSFVFPITLVDNIKALYDFIYEIDYTPSPTAQDISIEIQNFYY